MPSFANFGLFIWLVLGHTITLFAGCVVTVLLNWVERHILNGKKVPIPWDVAILLCFLFFACFQAWQDQYRENDPERATGSLSFDGVTSTIVKYGVSKESKKGEIQIGVKLENLQGQLVEYSVDWFDVQIAGKSSAGSHFTNRGGYIYAHQSSLFKAAGTPLDDVYIAPISGSVLYKIRYHVKGSSIIHHTNKSLDFEAFPSETHWIVTSEFED